MDATAHEAQSIAAAALNKRLAVEGISTVPLVEAAPRTP